MRRTLVLCVCLAALVLAAYAPVVQNGFVGYDDPEYVTENPHVNTGFTAENVAWAFTAAHSNNWHPLTWLSHAADCALFGLNPARQHLVSLLIHAANTVLLFLFLNAATGSWWRAAFIAAIFGVHPLHVESVAWIAERKDVLSMLFGLLALLAYLKNRRVLVAVFFACAVMSKPMLVTLPLLLLVLDWWPLQRKLSILDKLPLAAIAALASAATFWAQRKGGAVASLDALPLGLRISNATVSYVRYLGKTIWPSKLAVLYPFPVDGIAWWKAAASAALLVAITVLVVVYRKQRPWLLAGWCWYVVTLLPVIGIVQVGMQSMADRYMYLPMVGLLLAAVWEVPRPAMPLLPALVAVCAVLTQIQVFVWRDGLTLFEHAATVTENNFIAQNSIGVELDRRGQPDAALAHYREALRIRPGDRAATNNYAQALSEQGERLVKAERFPEALAAFQESLSHNAHNANAQLYTGILLASQGRYTEALRALNAALAIQPDLGLAKTAREQLLQEMKATGR